MAQIVEDGEFWLPPEFLTDDDILTEKKGNTKYSSGLGQGFAADVGSKQLFPYDLGLFGFYSDLGSPVESLVGSTETESDEEDSIAGLTRGVARSTLEDDSVRNNLTFPSDNTNAWGLTRTPEPTLCQARIGCCCRQRNCQSRLSSPAAAWEMYCAAVQEVTRMRKESYRNIHCSGLLGTPGKASHAPDPAGNANLGPGYYSSNQSLCYQKLRATQQLKQQQMMKHRQQQLIQNRARAACNDKGRTAHGLSSSAWPSLQQAQNQQRTGSGMRAVFLGNSTGKKECAGTGVFLPRRVNPATTTTYETRKKPALSTVLLPERVVQVLNLRLDDAEVQPHIEPRFDHEVDLNLNDLSFRFRNRNGFASQKRSVRAEQAATNEPRLPQDWSY